MKVVFLKSLPPYKVGQVASVADGYAQNFLFPRKLAQPATQKALQAAHDQQRADAAGVAEKNKANAQLREALSGVTIRLTAPTAPSGTLYAAITAQAVRQAVAKQLHAPVPEQVGEDMENIKSAGQHRVTWNLDGHLVTFTVEV